jgi:hypothetical protein
MAFELERILYETEDFLRRSLGSSQQRAAKKRKAQRQFMEFMRRLRRAGLILAVLLVMLVAASIALGGIGFFTWVVALPTALLIALISLSWPSGRKEPQAADPSGAPALPLAELAARAEDGLLDRCRELPGRAQGAADAILARLGEFQPHLADLDPQSVLAGDARRLIGQHLPRLVDSYLELPASARAPGSESSQRFTESLSIVSNELDSLLETCCRDRQMTFDTHRRFIETRYKDDGSLRSE